MRVSSDSLHKADIICLSLSRWDAPISSPAFSLAKQLGKTNRVFFLDHPFSWKDYFREKKTPAVQRRKKALRRGEDIYHREPGFSDGLTAVSSRLVYPVNFLPEGNLYNRLARINNAMLEKTLRQVILDNKVKDFIFINFFDPYYLGNLPDDILPLKYVYQCMDDLSQVSYTRRHGLRLEEELIRRADITLCTSRELTKLKSVFSPRVFYHPNGADVTLFRQAMEKQLSRPADMQFGDKKVIGMVGSIDYRTDVELLRKTAAHHPDKILFLLGPVMDKKSYEWNRGLPNLVFAGARKQEELPAYLRHFDCCIIPYLKNTLTRSIYPLKINEYLAAGRPVVATHFSEDIFAFRQVAEIAGSDDSFLTAIDTAIADDTAERQQERLGVATANSWEKRVGQFWEILAGQAAGRTM